MKKFIEHLPASTGPSHNNEALYVRQRPHMARDGLGMDLLNTSDDRGMRG